MTRNFQQCWSQNIEGEIIAAVSSNSKEQFAILYERQEANGTTYHIRYHNIIKCSFDKDEDIYDDFQVKANENQSIAALAINYNMIILSYSNKTNIQFVVMTKNTHI